MIAYYAHNHGNGHSNFANQFVKAKSKDSIIMTSSKFKFDNVPIIKLTEEYMVEEDYIFNYLPLPEYAHYLPKNHLNLAIRNQEITTAIIQKNIGFAMIDVSVETAAIFRLSGVPYAYRRMIGNRNDKAHTIAYKAAEFLFAYYPKELEAKNTPEWVIKKTKYSGFLSRFNYEQNLDFITLAKKPISELNILILAGMGGTRINNDLIEKIAKETKSKSISVIGGINNYTIKNKANIYYLGYQQNIEEHIKAADLVISSCGLSLSSEILALKNKFIAVPEKRPFLEQELFCKSLVRDNLAVELNISNIYESIQQFLELKPNPNIATYFSSMHSFIESNIAYNSVQCHKEFQ